MPGSAFHIFIDQQLFKTIVLVLGAGYHLVIVKTAECDVPRLTEVVKESVPSARLERESGNEVFYLMPDSASPSFPALLRTLEDRREKLGIVDFGATATTLEEVFLR